MSSNSTKKASGIFATLLIGMIVVSFMFGGYDSMRSTPDTIAKVGNQSIKVSEYQEELERQQNFFRSYYNGGNPLTRKQIEQFGIKQNAMKSLIATKLKLIVGENVGVFIGDNQVQQEVMDYSEPGKDNKPQKIFHTNGQFDIVKYKSLLGNSRRFSPASFEEMIRSKLEVKEASSIFGALPVSNTYAKEYTRLKSEAIAVDAVSIQPKSLSKYIVISNKEITEYLAEEMNIKRVKAVFKERKPKLDKPAQVKARHILFAKDTKNKISIADLRKKLTKKNFESMAKKYSEEPNANKSGGSLGWFGKGKMVPEFEKIAFSMKPGQISLPLTTKFGTHVILVEAKRAATVAKFNSHKKSIATEQIRKNKGKDSEKLLKKLMAKVQMLLKSKNTKAVKKLAKKYGLNFEKNQMVSKLERSAGNISFKAEQVEELFEKNNGALFVFDKDPMEVVIAMTKGNAKKEVNFASEKKMLANALRSKLQKEVTDQLEEEVGYKIYGEL